MKANAQSSGQIGAYDQAVNGYTKEERAIARTSVEKANAISRAFNRSSISSWSYAPRLAFTSANVDPANMYRRACRR